MFTTGTRNLHLANRTNSLLTAIMVNIRKIREKPVSLFALLPTTEDCTRKR